MEPRKPLVASTDTALALLFNMQKKLSNELWANVRYRQPVDRRPDTLGDEWQR
jgi:hypothetical protein